MSDDFQKSLNNLKQYHPKTAIDMIKKIKPNQWVVGYWSQKQILTPTYQPQVSGYYNIAPPISLHEMPSISNKTYLSYRPSLYIQDIRVESQNEIYTGPLILDLQGFKVNLRDQSNVKYMSDFFADIERDRIHTHYSVFDKEIILPLARAHDTFLEGCFDMDKTYTIEAYTLNVLDTCGDFSYLGFIN